jgi:hypothetical protein
MIGIVELRAAARITGTAHDARLTNLERAAVEFVQNRHRQFYGPEESYAERIQGGGTGSLWPAFRVASLPATISEYAYPGADATTITATASDGYELWENTQLVRKGGNSWTRGYIYLVTYTRGYDAVEVPPDVREAVTKVTVWWFERGIPAPRSGEVYSAPLPAHLDALLQSRKRPESGGKGSPASHEVTMRSRSDVGAEDSILWGALRLVFVSAPVNLDEHGEYIVIQARFDQ